jgi:hypothetical protein
VIGYHGCTWQIAEQILDENRFLPSTKAYDWLGEGVYFWEYAPYRALEWAEEKCRRDGGYPVVFQATINLGRCLNLLDIEHVPGLVQMYQSFLGSLGETQMPRNSNRGAHFLDRLIIDAYCRLTDEEADIPVQSVRGSFAEGEPIYPGSKILHKAHAQLAVRDASCITSATLVQFP